MLFDILTIVSTLLIITLLQRLVIIFPSLIACLSRAKESISLEASVKLSYDRNIIALGMIVPFCLLVVKYHLYDPVFISSMTEAARIGLILGIFISYQLLRVLISFMIKSGKVKNMKIYNAGEKLAYTFFIILTLVLFFMSGIMSLIGIDLIVIKSSMLWVSAAIYLLYLLRKLQIFISGCSFFAGFLYLCALEIIPTGLLVASEIIF